MPNIFNDIEMENLSLKQKISAQKQRNYHLGVMLGAENELLLIMNFVNAFKAGRNFFSYLLLTLLKYLS